MDTNVRPLDDAAGTRILKLALLGGAFAMLCLFFLLMFTWFQPDQLSLSERYFPSPTATHTPKPTFTATSTLTPSPTHTPTPTLAPTITPTPHLLLAAPEGVTVVEETFDSNTRGWIHYYSSNAMNIDNGELSIRSKEVGYIGVAACMGCVGVAEQTLYLQADLRLAKNSPIDHGLVYCAASKNDSFYAFRINQAFSYYMLSRHYDEDWDTLIAGTRTDVIHKYPASNTLSVYFDQGKMDLYINDQLVDSYVDPEPFACSWLGIIIDNGTLNLMADNLYAYTVKPGFSTSTPTP